jgi:predicted dehydrogenase
MITERLKIAQIGTKHAHAKGKYETICKLSDAYDVIGVVEPDNEQQEKISGSAAYADARWITEEEVFNTEGLKVVTVETDMDELVPTAIRCLEAGLHIHLDKPAGSSMSECRRMHAIADAAGLTIQMGYMFRYNAAFQFLYKALDAGWIGAIMEVNAMIGKLVAEDMRPELNRWKGGGMYELAGHLVDQVVTVMGAPEAVTNYHFASRPDGDGLNDNQTSVFSYPSAVAILRSNHIDPHKRRMFEVIGENGAVVIDPLEPPAVRVSFVDPPEGFDKGWQPVELRPPTGRYDGDLYDLAKIVRGESKLAWDSAHDLAMHEALLRAGGMVVD